MSNKLDELINELYKKELLKKDALSSHLSQFYKTSLNKGKRQISIQNELAITKHNIAIQHIRFENRFIEHWEVGDFVKITFVHLPRPVHPCY